MIITMDSAAVQADWLERVNKQIATLRPWWQTLQDAGGEKIADEMIAALPRNGTNGFCLSLPLISQKR